ncbi:MAG: preprotein translocase subunit YajC [Bacillota bacterium]
MAGNPYFSIVMTLVLFGFLYFFMIRPQQKREKQVKEMRNSLQVGDHIVTIGGIYGKILKIKDDTLTIEVGADKTKLQIARWAVGNLNKSEVSE